MLEKGVRVRFNHATQTDPGDKNTWREGGREGGEAGREGGREGQKEGGEWEGRKERGTELGETDRQTAFFRNRSGLFKTTDHGGHWKERGLHAWFLSSQKPLSLHGTAIGLS